MILNPTEPYQNESYAEQTVFKAFQYITIPDGICFHSLHLPEHPRKKESEADFVLICARGIFVFEVKGGRVFQEKGKWFSFNKRRKIAIQNPFIQSQEAHYVIRDFLKQNALINAKVPIGYAVLMPDTISFDARFEYDRSIYAIKKDVNIFAFWLNKLMDFWIERTASILEKSKPCTLTNEQIWNIAEALRPNSMFQQTKKQQERSLNSQQQKIVHAFLANKKIICEGAFGTGKTSVIQEIARNYIKDHERLLILCHSEYLANKLKYTYFTTNVTVSTVNSIDIDARRAFVSKYDVIIVDQAENFFQKKQLQLIEAYLEGGFVHGRWLLFQDAEKLAELKRRTEFSLIQQFCELADENILLNYTYRYQNNFDFSNLFTLNKIVMHRSKNEDDELKLLQEIILNNITQLNEITILSTKDFHKSIASKLPKNLSKEIVQLDPFNVRYFPLCKITFSLFSNFIGLENKLIILVDFDEFDFNNPVTAYDALSRSVNKTIVLLASPSNQSLQDLPLTHDSMIYV